MQTVQLLAQHLPVNFLGDPKKTQQGEQPLRQLKAQRFKVFR
jgi:hypothetical protein